jgi:pyrroline-5-carboxylate reductase
MKLGFIGVGKIATSVIEGIFNTKINIYLVKRQKEINILPLFVFYF